MSNTPNPLSEYFRSPKLFVKLPTGGMFYDKDIVEYPESGELPVFPMTAKDEVMMKNPDALLNGEAVCSLISSCVPNVKNPRLMISNDVDTLLIAIQGATNGDDIEVSAELVWVSVVEYKLPLPSSFKVTPAEVKESVFLWIFSPK